MARADVFAAGRTGLEGEDRKPSMFQIIGIVLLFAMVFGGYVISGGHFEVIIESMPHEMMTIGGAAVAALLLGNSIGDVKKTLGEIGKAF